MIGFCTDSNAQLPPELVERYGVEVVPLTVTVDGRAYLEGVDLDADGFFARYEEGASPVVSTAAPGPGQFAEAYRRLAARGCDEILSVHIGSSVSGTFAAARLAAHQADVPVRLVDTGTASFGVACCLWEAAEAVVAGATLEEAATVAEAVAGRIGTVFMVGALGIARAGGRLDASVRDEVGAIPVLTLADGQFRPIGVASDPDEAATVMAEHILAAGVRLRVGLTVADRGAEPLWRALEARLAGAEQVVDLVHYRAGPSVAAHTGPGTCGAVFYDARF